MDGGKSYTFSVETRSKRYVRSIPPPIRPRLVCFCGGASGKVEELLVRDDVELAGTDGGPDRGFTSAPRWGAIEVPRNL